MQTRTVFLQRPDHGYVEVVVADSMDTAALTTYLAGQLGSEPTAVNWPPIVGQLLLQQFAEGGQYGVTYKQTGLCASGLELT